MDAVILKSILRRFVKNKRNKKVYTGVCVVFEKRLFDGSFWFLDKSR